MEQRHGFPFILSDRSRSRPVISARWLPPTAALRSQVTAIANVDNRAQALRALPASGALLAIRFGGTVFDGDTALPAVSLTGIQQAARRFHYSGPVRSVLLRLTPQAVRSFGAEAAELVDRTVGLPDLGCNALASLSEELARAADTATLTANDVSGTEDTSIDLDLGAALTDTDGSESISSQSVDMQARST